MYHYSARQALMEAKRQELAAQAQRAKALREARAARGGVPWLKRPRPARARRFGEPSPRRPAEQPS